MKAMNATDRPGALRRYGPLVAVLAAIAAVAALVIGAAPPGGDRAAAGGSTGARGTTGVAGAEQLPKDVMPFFVAKAAGTVGDYDWGKRCDVTTGKLALPLSPAPDCFAVFTGDNGGATSTGVTKDAIKVVVYTPQDNDAVLSFIYRQIGSTDTPDKTFATYRSFNEILATYYETYGRRVELVQYKATGATTDAVAAATDAETIARDIGPFAVIGGPSLSTAFADTLAANQVLCMSCTPSGDNEFYAKRAPYVWGITANSDENAIMVSQYVANRLAGGKATHGGDAVKSQARKFGYIYVSATPEAEQGRRHFEELLAQQGVAFTDVASYKDPLSLAGQAREILARMKDRGVTTVLFTGDPLAPQTLTQAATEQEYFPEWVLAGTALVDTTIFGRTYDQAQWAHAFGPTGLFARVSPKVAGAGYLHQWFWGRPPEAQQAALILPSLQLLYGALQGVGPDVTAQHFEDRLFASPVIEGNVLAPQISWGDHGFWPFTDRNGIDDQTEVWWDPTATGPDELGNQGTGMWAYANGGQRFLPGKWPKSPPAVFGDDPDPVTLYTQLPEGITLPDYAPLPPAKK